MAGAGNRLPGDCRARGARLCLAITLRCRRPSPGFFTRPNATRAGSNVLCQTASAQPPTLTWHPPVPNRPPAHPPNAARRRCRRRARRASCCRRRTRTTSWCRASGGASRRCAALLPPPSPGPPPTHTNARHPAAGAARPRGSRGPGPARARRNERHPARPPSHLRSDPAGAARCRSRAMGRAAATRPTCGIFSGSLRLWTALTSTPLSRLAARWWYSQVSARTRALARTGQHALGVAQPAQHLLPLPYVTAPSTHPPTHQRARTHTRIEAGPWD